MSLENFGRALSGKPPKDRSMTDRMLVTNDDGCSYDQQVMTVRLPLGVGIAVVGGMLVVAWASGDPLWTDLTDKLSQFLELLTSTAGT